MHIRATLRLLTLFLGLVLVLVACGGEDEDPPESPTETVAPAASPTSEATSTVSENADREEPETADDEALANKPIPDQPAPTSPPPPPSSFDTDGDGVLSVSELRNALNANMDDFTFPDGYELISPDRMIENALAGLPDDATEDNVTFETTAATGWIGGPHMCAWAQTWLDAYAAGDTETQDIAMDQLMTVSLNLPSFRLVVDYYRDIFEKAQLGDIAPLQNHVDVNCYWNSFESTPEPETAGPPATNKRTNTARLTSFFSHAR